eukprot:TRINITY_DN1183_c0_g5_i1.p1 TRINITY_DN1183_c0_g5~~TRINITY_DN1183_c0_g5_i1.p1  ORF type:complete len:370 (+),score=146.70 TRINITY_DN1183_c0_g5_i1:255-1364(+)
MHRYQRVDVSSKKVSIDLRLNNSQFHPGDLIEGEITVLAKSSIKCRGIRLYLSGFERVRWQEIDGREHFYVLSHIDVTQVLWGGPKHSAIRTLHKGIHTWQINSLFLPHKTPASLIHPIGQVLYQIRIVIDRPFKTNVQKVLVFVVSPLQKTLLMDSPVIQSGQKRVNQLKISSNKTAYSPGETILASVTFTGDSDEATSHPVQLLFLVEETFRDEEGKHKRTVAIEQQSCDSHATGSQIGSCGEVTKRFEIKLAQELPPTTEYTRLTRFEYLLSAESNGLQATLPIIILWSINVLSDYQSTYPSWLSINDFVPTFREDFLIPDHDNDHNHNQHHHHHHHNNHSSTSLSQSSNGLSTSNNISITSSNRY